jgi:hypothetical protein
MNRTFSRAGAWLPVIWAATVAAVAVAEESVVLRAADGRFLREADDGAVRADPLVPGPCETFQLLQSGKDRIALKTPRGRFLAVAGPTGQTLRAAGLQAKPGQAETFLLVPAAGSRVALKTAAGRWVVFQEAKAGANPAPQGPNDKPRPEQLVEIYRAMEIPSAIQTALGAAVNALVKEELSGKEYDKTESRLKETYVELPAPTLRDLKRKRRERLWAVREETRIQARLEGQPAIRITAMPYLRSGSGPETRLLMFAASAEVPVSGRVGVKLGDAPKAAANFRTVAVMDVAGQVRVEKSDERMTLRPPEVLKVEIALRNLDISNDLINAAREPIQDIINQEIRKQHGRILEQANRSIRKAFEGREFRHPLLRYLGLP